MTQEQVAEMATTAALFAGYFAWVVIAILGLAAMLLDMRMSWENYMAKRKKKLQNTAEEK